MHLVAAWLLGLDQVGAGQRLEQAAGLSGVGRRRARRQHTGPGQRRGAGPTAGTPARPWSPGAGRTRRTPPAPRSRRHRRRSAGRAAAAGRPVRSPDRPAGRRRGAAASSAATRSASGSRQHCPASAAVAAGSAAARPPISARSRSDCLLGRQQAEIQPRGAVAGDQPGQRVAAGHHHHAAEAVPGSSGRTWSADPALSSSTSIRRPASRLR